MEPALLFIEKVRHLRELVADPTEYRMLQAAAIARHLLLDGEPLARVAARITGLKLHFPVGCRGTVEHYGAITDTKPTLFTVGHSVDPMRPQRPLAYLRLDAFLALKLAILHREEYSVRDVINYSANTAGGVHHRPKDERSAGMRAGAQFLIGGLPQFEQLMEGISHAILWGVRGAEAKLQTCSVFGPWSRVKAGWRPLTSGHRWTSSPTSEPTTQKSGPCWSRTWPGAGRNARPRR